ncbi:unnamed protein product [Symbiodinium pilosum]|uniref:Uncharacterized protein n=1 Tax=Symbiodinium pilosum TaxID=2952 RepID=A0A812Y6B0_SYMPI|nr:unnamed protein product [Symbiodinium pilosum]
MTSRAEDLQDKLQVLQAERDELNKKIPETGYKSLADVVQQSTASRREALQERRAREQYQQALEKVERELQRRLPTFVGQKNEIQRFKTQAAQLTKQNEQLLAKETVEELQAQHSEAEDAERAKKAAEAQKILEDYAGGQECQEPGVG